MPDFRHQPFRLPGILLAILFVAAALGGCLDYQLGAIPYTTFSVAIWQRGAIFILLAALLFSDRDGPWPPRIQRFGWMLLGGLAVCYAMHDWADLGHRRYVIASLLTSWGLYLWMVTLWWGAALLGRIRPDGAPRSPWLRGGVALLLVYDTLCLGSVAASTSLDISLYAYPWERALLFAPLLGWVRAAECDAALRGRTGRWLAVLLGLLVVTSALIAGLDKFGPAALHRHLLAWELVYQRGRDAGPTLPDHRILFPMLDFNRAGYFAMIALFALLAAAISDFARPGGRAPWLRRVAWGAAVVCALVVVFASYTRGVILATLVGLLVWAFVSSRRLALAIVIAGLVGLVLLPHKERDHLRTVFDPDTYELSEGTLTSAKARMLAWRWGIGAIAERPVAGFGYGHKIVRQAYRDYVETRHDVTLDGTVNALRPINHLHNVWLETAAESGLFAALALLGLTILRAALEIRLLLAASGPDRRIAAVWLGLEAALLLAGMVFYMLKQNSGMLTWFVWFWILVDLAARRSAHASQPTSG